jgi:dipeptide/tripeptide permease
MYIHVNVFCFRWQEYMKTYFSLFYAAINSGSLISTILTPILRQEVSCAGQETCYPAAFGVPAALMVVSIRKCLSRNYYIIIIILLYNNIIIIIYYYYN